MKINHCGQRFSLRLLHASLAQPEKERHTQAINEFRRLETCAEQHFWQWDEEEEAPRLSRVSFDDDVC